MDQRRFFLTTAPGRLFAAAAVPGMVSMLASALYQLADGVLVGRILGDTPFAALNLAMPFVIINFAISDMIGVGSSVPISIALGHGDDDAANEYFTASCLSIFISGTATGALLFLAAPALIGLMGAEGIFAEYAVQYLRVYALCSPLTTIVYATDNYLRICGKIKSSMALNIFMSGLSAFLEFLFLFVFDWGIWAAALGTCLGMMAAAVIALTPFALGKMKLRFCRPKVTPEMIGRIIRSGLPTFLNNIAGRITSIVMNMMLVRLGGETAVSVYGILMYADGLILPLLYGMCDALQPAVGYNWGAGRPSRVRAIEKYCFGASGAISLVSGTVLFLFPEAVALVFMTGEDPAYLAMAVTGLKLFSVTYLTRWISLACQSLLQAIEKSLAAACISVAMALLFPMALLAVLNPLGLTGIWLNFPGTSLLGAVLAVILLRRQWPALAAPDRPVWTDEQLAGL